MKETIVKTAKYIRIRKLLYTLAFGLFAILILIKENSKLIALIFIPIGAIVLTLVYYKMYTFIKRLERMQTNKGKIL